MKKLIFISLMILGNSFLLLAQNNTSISVLSDKMSQTIVSINVGDIVQQKVFTPKGKELKISVPNGTQLLEKGAPDLPKLSFSVIIPNQRNSIISIEESDYTDIQGIDIAPSKGKIYRDVLPSTIPFIYGEEYNKNEFYPKEIAVLNAPYILRDFRGQSVQINPVQYNPITHTLRVYHSLKLKIDYIGLSTENCLPNAELPNVVVNEFDGIYSNHFINYKTTGTRYTPLTQIGSILVLCPANYLSEIQPYIKWKQMKGFKTYLVNTDTMTGGVNENTVLALVSNYYITKHIAYLTIVGDHPNIPARNSDFSSTFLLGPSDNGYAYQSGNDHYPEFIVGRFSGETKADIVTQVKRTIDYEKTPNTSTNWVQKQVGIASDQGPGDDFQMDYEHIRNIMDSNKNQYNYVQNFELFDGSHGGDDGPGNPNANDLSTLLNNGLGLLNYCGHGSNNQCSTTGFSSADVDNLTNIDGKLPFMFVTACLNGDFTLSTCIAEALLRAQDVNGNPKGAIATLMSTILQSWDPPMQGQDEINAILRGARPANRKTTFGALAMNGCMSVNDEYNTASDPDGGNEITDTWTVFGDPSLEVRTKHEGTLTATHTAEIGRNSTWYTVACPVEGATIGLYYQGEFLAVGTVSGGNATFTFPAIANTDTVFITATKQNYVPYLGYAKVVDFPATVNEVNANNNLVIYPNPTQDEVSITTKANDVILQIEIIDMLGNKVLGLSPDTSSSSISLKSFADGIYQIKVTTTKGIMVGKLTKKN